MDLGLKDRVCVVTGSTGGIGLETARSLVAEGAHVVTSGRSEAPRIGEALHVRADLSQPGEPERVLAEAGEVDVLRTADGEAIYRRCATGEHHHHLVCRSCGASVEVASDAVESWAASTAELHGFTDVEHTAELYGVCGGCSAS